MVRARGLLGSRGTNKAKAKGVPRGPALLAVIGGLGAAGAVGAAAAKRRGSAQTQPQGVPSEPEAAVGTQTAPVEPT
jgi:hypothetical protein